MNKAGNYLVPYDEKGNLLHYARVDKFFKEDYPRYNLCENAVFLATMQVQPGIMRGRSAKYVHLKDVHTSCLYPMFIVDLVDAISQGTVTQGIFSSTYWRVQKRGQNFGLRRAKSDEI